jgi:hypothetical protein
MIGRHSSDPSVRTQTDLSYRSYSDQYVQGQPSFESAPTANGWLATDPTWIEENLRWDNLAAGERDSLRRVQNNFEPDNFFFTAIVGALPAFYGLGKYREFEITNRTLHIYAEARRTSSGGGTTPAPDEPSHIYDYTFTLWRVLDGSNPPNTIDFNFRLGELQEDTETSE